MTLDLLVFAAHPDDAEIAAGGLLARARRLGQRTGIVDLTRGELGSRGTPETRAAESAAADRVLGVAVRENLSLPDGGLVPHDLEARRLVVDAIRRHRPRLVAAPHVEDLHPDHAAAGRILADAFYPSGFANYRTGEAGPYRPAGLVHYMNHLSFPPSFVLDITDVWEMKLEAIRCYASQLHREGASGPATNISRPEFLATIEGRARHYGMQIGATFGEPWFTARPVPVRDPVALFAPEVRP